MHDTTIHVRPGVYGPCLGDNTCLFMMQIPYRYHVLAEEGPHETIIDGQGGYSAVGYMFYEPAEWCGTWDGFTIRNAENGTYCGRYENCIITGCGLGLEHSEAVNCLVYGNTSGGVNSSLLWNCTVVSNVGSAASWSSVGLGEESVAWIALSLTISPMGSNLTSTRQIGSGSNVFSRTAVPFRCHLVGSLILRIDRHSVMQPISFFILRWGLPA